MVRQGGRGGRSVTRRDVAERAGVSAAVVSYTLNGGAPVAPETAQRVLKAVAELGYRPNQAARALRSGSTRTLAFLTLDADDAIFTNPIFAEYVHAVQRAAAERGYALYTASTPGGGRARTMQELREFASRQVDGVVLLASSEQQLDPAELDAVGVPWVLVNTEEAPGGGNSIGADLFGGATVAMGHLFEHGYSSIGFVGDAPRSEPRRRAWREVCAEHGVEASPLFDVDFTREGGRQAALELADLSSPPRAVFVVSDRTALGVLRGLHECGVRVPQDVAVLSFDGSWESAYAWPGLTSVRQPIEEMAAAAVDRLISPSEESSHQVFPVELIVRESCGAHA